MTWTRRIADEFWSGPVTSITFSLLAETMAEHMVRRPLRSAGLDTLASEPVLLHHASHVYVNADLLGAVIGLLPAALRSEGLLTALPPTVRAGLGGGGLLRAGPGAAAIAARLLLRERDWAPWRRAAAFDRACADVRAAFAGQPQPSPDQGGATLVEEITRVRARLGEYLGVVSWGIVYAYVFHHLTAELARRWAPDLPEERAALTVGLPGVVSLAIHGEVRELGVLLAASRSVLDTVRSEGPAAGWARIVADRGPIREAFHGFLARHGHRLTARDLLRPSWRDAPEVVVGLAAQSVEEGARAPLADPVERRRRATTAIERVVASGPGGTLRRAAFRASLTASQRYAAVRENMRYHADYVLARLRALALALGSRLTDAGRLEAPLDVCFLTLEEAEDAVRGADVGAFAAERRAAFERHAATPPPALDLDEAEVGNASASAPAADTARALAPATLAGEAASPGRCRARARVVRGPEDFGSVARGEVLVAAYVDSTWTPVLELASGLVLEAGGQLSHGAIVARELGIPALVNVAAATRAIRDGDSVLLDATAGVVSIERRTAEASR